MGEPGTADAEGVERSVGLMVRLTPGEREGWHAAARAAGWGKTASWVRQVVAERVTGASAPGASAGGSSGRGVVEQLARVRAELVRIGVNVNQVAFQVNAGAVAGSPVEVELVRRELAAARAELGALRIAVQALVDGPAQSDPSAAPAGPVTSMPGAAPAVPAGAWDREQQAVDAARVAAARAEVARLEALRAQIAARSPLGEREGVQGGGVR